LGRQEGLHGLSPSLGLKWFPEEGFYIHSQRTNTILRFDPDHETMEAHEFFDGEASAYYARGTDIKVQVQMA
jgi:hypothetical protein